MYIYTYQASCLRCRVRPIPSKDACAASRQVACFPADGAIYLPGRLQLRPPLYIYCVYNQLFNFIYAYLYDAFSFLSEKAIYGASYPILEAEVQAIC